MSSIDPDLIGIWIVPGAGATYEVAPDGSYHVADPEAELQFEDDGATMLWGAVRLVRMQGAGDTPLGRWKDEASGEIWWFARDGQYEVTAPGLLDRGIWALRDGGTALWIREYRARLETNGAQVLFHPVDGAPLTYGYTVANGAWTLHDATTWAELARYLDPAALAATG